VGAAATTAALLVDPGGRPRFFAGAAALAVLLVEPGGLPSPGSRRNRAQQRWQGLPCAVGFDRDQSDWGFLRFEESY
jgi:hypothetical protein